MSPFTALLIDYLRRAKSLGFHEKDLAERLDISPGMITHIKDEQDKMRVEWLPKAADFFGLIGQERDDFLFEGECMHMPNGVAAAYRRSRLDLRDSNTEMAKTRIEIAKLRAENASLGAQVADLRRRLGDAGL